jgi:flavin-dependent dehydrogenase
MGGRNQLDADVIVVGGGPAGSTLGCLLANGRHKAVIIERASGPRERVGELLTPSVNTVLHRIGLLNRVDAMGFVRREGIGWTAPRAPRSRVLTIPVAEHPAPRALRRYGFNVERDAFDALLLQYARERGACVLDRTTARRVVFERGRAVGVEVRGTDGAVRLLFARFVVDATGRSCLLGSQLGLVRRGPSGRRCAMYAWFRGVEPCATGCDSYAFLHVLDRSQSWGWQIPLRDGVSSIGVVAECDRFRGAAPNRDDLFRRMIGQNPAFARAVAGARRIRPWHLAGDYGYRLDRAYGNGYLLVGDSSGFIDPVFASGVDVAVHSAAFAYESILPLLMLGHWSDSDEEFALSRYDDRLRQGTAVWEHAVDLFYRLPCSLRRLLRKKRFVPAICRFLQGNPYEVQNQLIVQHLVDQLELGGIGKIADGKIGASSLYANKRIATNCSPCEASTSTGFAPRSQWSKS